METQKKRWWHRAADILEAACASAAEVARYRPQAASLGHQFSARDLRIALALTMAASASLSLIYTHSEPISPTPARRRASDISLSNKAPEDREAPADTCAKLGDAQALSSEKRSQPEESNAQEAEAPQ